MKFLNHIDVRRTAIAILVVGSTFAAICVFVESVALKDRVRRQAGRIDDLNSAITGKSEHLRILEEQRQRLAANLRDAVREYTQFRSATKKEIADLASQLMVARSTISSQAQKFSILQGRFVELKVESQRAESKLRSELDSNNIQLQQARLDCLGLKEERDQIQAGAQKREVERAAQIHGLECQIAEATAAHAQTVSKLQVEREQFARDRQRFVAASAGLERERDEIRAESKKAQAGWEARIEALTRDAAAQIANLNQKLAEIRDGEKSTDCRAGQPSDESAPSPTQAHAVKEIVGPSGSVCAELEERIAKIEKERDEQLLTLIKEREELESALCAAEDNAVASELQIKDIRRECAAQLVAMQTRMQAAATARESAEADLAEVRGQLDNSLSELEKVRSEDREEISALRGRLIQSKNKSVEIQNLAADLSAKTKEMESRLARLAIQTEADAKALGESRQAIRTLCDTIKSLRAQMETHYSQEHGAR